MMEKSYPIGGDSSKAIFVAVIQPVHNRSSFFNELNNKLLFPYFGYNRDALYDDRGIDSQTKIEVSEFETVNFENLIRKEEGNPLRTKYDKDMPKELWGKVTIWN